MRRTRLKGMVVLGLTMAWAGCFTPPSIDKVTVERVESQVRITRDEFKKITHVMGGEILLTPTGESWYRLIVSQGAVGWPIYTLRLHTERHHTQGWAFWKEAFDEDGVRYVGTKVQSDVATGGGTIETIDFDLSSGWLRAKSTAGVKMRVDGQRAQQLVILPPNYIKGFMTKADQTLGAPKP